MWSKISVLVVSSGILLSCGPAVTVQCPPLVTYDRAFMQKLADELEQIGSDTAVARAIVDYRRLRDLIRACRG